MNDMSPAEVARKFDQIDRRFDDTVYKAVYEANITEIRSDVSEIKEGQKWIVRLVAAQLFGAVVAFAVWAITSAATAAP